MKPRKDFYDAVINKRRLEFFYNGTKRTGEPQCYGINTRDNEAIRMYQIEGGSKPEELLLVDKIKAYKILNEHFTKPGPNYKRDDSAMKEIFVQL
jgi:hypothetical protein